MRKKKPLNFHFRASQSAQSILAQIYRFQEISHSKVRGTFLYRFYLLLLVVTFAFRFIPIPYSSYMLEQKYLIFCR